MPTFTPRDVVWTEFPFTDMSATKWRPALVLRQISPEDYLMCQLTSKRYAEHFVELAPSDFDWGQVEATNAANPVKIFVLHVSLMEHPPMGRLGTSKFNDILLCIRKLFEE